MRAEYEAQVFPRLRAFRPELIVISAGFKEAGVIGLDDPVVPLQPVL